MKFEGGWSMVLTTLKVHELGGSVSSGRRK